MNSGYPLNNNNFNWERHIAKKIGSSSGGDVDPSASNVAKLTDGQYQNITDVPVGELGQNEGWTTVPETSLVENTEGMYGEYVEAVDGFVTIYYNAEYSAGNEDNNLIDIK